MTLKKFCWYHKKFFFISGVTTCPSFLKRFCKGWWFLYENLINFVILKITLFLLRKKKSTLNNSEILFKLKKKNLKNVITPCINFYDSFFLSFKVFPPKNTVRTALKDKFIYEAIKGFSSLTSSSSCECY